MYGMRSKQAERGWMVGFVPTATLYATVLLTKTRLRRIVDPPKLSRDCIAHGKTFVTRVNHEFNFPPGRTPK